MWNPRGPSCRSLARPGDGSCGDFAAMHPVPFTVYSRQSHLADFLSACTMHGAGWSLFYLQHLAPISTMMISKFFHHQRRLDCSSWIIDATPVVPRRPRRWHRIEPKWGNSLGPTRWNWTLPSTTPQYSICLWMTLASYSGAWGCQCNRI